MLSKVQGNQYTTTRLRKSELRIAGQFIWDTRQEEFSVAWCFSCAFPRHKTKPPNRRLTIDAETKTNCWFREREKKIMPN
jgi:hypothetical protein